MAAAAVTAELGKERHHVAGEVDRRVLVEAFYEERHARLFAAEPDQQLGRAIRDTRDLGSCDARHRLVGHLHATCVRDIEKFAARRLGRDNDLLLPISALQQDAGGLDAQGLDRRLRMSEGRHEGQNCAAISPSATSYSGPDRHEALSESRLARRWGRVTASGRRGSGR